MPLAELDLLDYRRRVFALYARVRAAPDPARAFADWVAERDELFASHPQSALPPERRAGASRIRGESLAARWSRTASTPPS